MIHTSRWLFPVLIATMAGTLAATFAAAPATLPAAVSDANKAAALTHFSKAKDLYSQGKFQDALTEDDQAMLLDPTLSDAQLLRRVLTQKIDPTGAGGDTGVAAGGGGVATGKPKTLTTAQISIIRMLEMSADDRNIRGSIPRKTLEDFWDNVIKKDTGADLSKAARDAFLNPANFVGQAQRIRDSGDLKYIDQVTLTTDPAILAYFHNNIHNFVVLGCATADCHGGDKAGNFRLITGSNNDQTVYTNFYIMSTYQDKTGGQMINRDNPEKSLFLQYSLPKNLAETPHPGKPDPHKLSGPTDPRFIKMTQWIQSLNIPRPNYGITFELPGATAVPASLPTTAPAATRTR